MAHEKSEQAPFKHNILSASTSSLRALYTRLKSTTPAPSRLTVCRYSYCFRPIIVRLVCALRKKPPKSHLPNCSNYVVLLRRRRRFAFLFVSVCLFLYFVDGRPAGITADTSRASKTLRLEYRLNASSPRVNRQRRFRLIF